MAQREDPVLGGGKTDATAAAHSRGRES